MDEWLELLPAFLLVLVRITAFFVAAPLFSLRGIPNSFKVGLSFFVAVITFATVSVEEPLMLDMSFILLTVKEAIVGLALGFVAALVIYSVQVAGAFIDFQMGFLIANLVDPQTGAQIPVIGNFKYILTLLFLLSVNGHHLLIDGVMRSYQLVPIEEMYIALGSAGVQTCALPILGSAGVAQFMARTFTQMFLIAFQMAIPIVGSLFLVDVALGILARTVPQVNVFVVGLPLKIFVGFCLILITLPGFFYLLQTVVREMVQSMGQLLQLLGGS